MPINMSYCRFSNTLEALRECYAALDEAPFGDPLELLSEEERKAAKRLLQLCDQMAEEYGER